MERGQSGLLVEIEDYAQGLVGDCWGGGEGGGERTVWSTCRG